MKHWMAGLAICAGLVSSPTTENLPGKNTMPDINTSSKEVIRPRKNNVLFTVNDGPSIYTLEIAKTLDSLGYEAIFYVVGAGITEKTKADLVEVVKMGHKIGNHSFSHPVFPGLNISSAQQEILKTDTLINEILKEAHVTQNEKYIRYPYGVGVAQGYSKTFNGFLDSLQYAPPMFRHMDVDLLDRQKQPSDNAIYKMKQGDTILLHEKPWTVETIQKIVSTIEDNE